MLVHPESPRDRDQFLKGMIWAFQEVLQAEPEKEKVKIEDIENAV